MQKKRATSFLKHVREAIGLLHKATSQAKSRRHEPEDSCLEFSFMYKEPLWSAVHITHIILHIAFAVHFDSIRTAMVCAYHLSWITDDVTLQRRVYLSITRQLVLQETNASLGPNT